MNELVSGKIKAELSGFNQNYSLKFGLISLIQSFFTKKTASRGGAVLNRYFSQLYQQFEAVGDSVPAEKVMENIESVWRDVAGSYRRKTITSLRTF